MLIVRILATLFFFGVFFIPKVYSEGSAENVAIEEIIVTANFRNQELLTTPSSVSVISGQSASKRGAQHLEQLLGMVPNVNFSAGASRGKFVQIRGIGERSQFKDPLESSVGLILDGIDLSGLGLASTLSDLQQVEFLRGPQGTVFGSSAMAGLILLKGNETTDSFSGNVSAGIGNYGGWHSGLTFSGPLTEGLRGRVSAHQFRGNGYTANRYFTRNDTNGFNEFTFRAKLDWQLGNISNLSLNYLIVDANNGYDAFSLENNRETASDEPGHDRQKTHALGAQFSRLFKNVRIDLNGFWEKTDLAYGFDWDWSNFEEVFWKGSEDNIRDRDSFGFDVKLLSDGPSRINWLIGARLYHRDVDLNSSEYCCGYGEAPFFFNSHLNSKRAAVFGQIDMAINDKWSMSLGGRWERYDDEYRDSGGVEASPKGDLWGLSYSIEFVPTDMVLVYGSISRGFKPGGINGQAVAGATLTINQEIVDFLEERLTFNSEALINYEVGVKGYFFDSRLTASVSAFMMDRKKMQAKAWVLFPPSNWQSYIDNVDGGENLGAEFSIIWDISERLSLEANLGYLDTKLGDLIVQDIDTGFPIEQDGREQAHAPRYQFSFSAEYKLTTNYLISASLEGKDAYYFSNSHNIRSQSYELFHATLQYRSDPLVVTLWGRNILNTDYFVRGFYFGNNPANNFENESYTQLGEPRTYGITMKYQF